jgi:GNAT superfamily N-acetyltransferase
MLRPRAWCRIPVGAWKEIKLKVELSLSPAAEDLKIISQGIESFNENHIPVKVVYEPDTRFAVFARDDSGNLIGGIRANAFWNYCIIELLWLSEAARGKGLGSQMMKEVEAHAHKLGFQYVRTETLDFQAKPFYEKLGYEVSGELMDYPKGHSTYCLAKKL